METILDRDEKWYMKSLDVIRKAIKKKKRDAENLQLAIKKLSCGQKKIPNQGFLAKENGKLKFQP